MFLNFSQNSSCIQEVTEDYKDNMHILTRRVLTNLVCLKTVEIYEVVKF